ncbi:helix-turn-helix protein [Delftia sp. 60]|uniref:helix-turn-helix domain-containing protein n=1 Tax=Delftia TaxID=80865 RepID=UPI000C19C2AC|nr:MULTISPECIES: helix-turn-helix domain-containing protein [Delftia]PIF39601.1 helix-turn-helix protein [Burkholderiales bacterium 23]PIF65218.1 helix-turn-helix protein [Delftia sp. 60]
MRNKLEFALRLRQAIEAAGLEPRPSVLLKLFNSSYWGRPISFQAVSRWLNGEAVPEQDKLVLLAGLLEVEPDVLRYGESAHRSPPSLPSPLECQEPDVGYLERETFDAFLKLPAPQRQVVREVILTFAKVHGEG